MGEHFLTPNFRNDHFGHFGRFGRFDHFRHFGHPWNTSLPS